MAGSREWEEWIERAQELLSRARHLQDAIFSFDLAARHAPPELEEALKAEKRRAEEELARVKEQLKDLVKGIVVVETVDDLIECSRRVYVNECLYTKIRLVRGGGCQ